MPLAVLLLGLLSLYGARQLTHLRVGEPPACRERHYIQIRGDLGRSGVYEFRSPPTCAEALRAAGLTPGGEDPAQVRLSSGDALVVGERGSVRVGREEMNGFFKVTLGIPLSINREPEVALTALPQIGPRLAQAIVEERQRRGGFRSVEELSSVPGIGPVRFTRIRPCVKL